MESSRFYVTPLCRSVYFATQHGDLYVTSIAFFALRVVFFDQNKRSLRKIWSDTYLTILRQGHMLCSIT